MTVYFYSHAREGRDYFIFIGKDEFSISTHTPARGVTDKKIGAMETTYISTHTPARGVTF